MNLLNKIIPFSVVLLGLYANACRPDKPFVSDATSILLEEKDIILNSERLYFQLVNDSIVILQHEDKGPLKYNLLSGKLIKYFKLHDSIRPWLLEKTRQLFSWKNIFSNQDSILKARKIDYITKDLYLAKSYYINDTLYIIGGYCFMENLGYMKGVKNKIMYSYELFPLICKTDPDMNVYTCFPLYQDTVTDINIGGTGHSFTINKNRYFFPNGMTYLMINPGGMQVRAYDETNNRFNHPPSGSWLLPLSEELVKKMGYTDTTERNSGKGERLEYRMKTVNGNVFYCNGFELYNLTAGKSIFDGIENDFRIKAYSVDSGYNCIVLAHWEDKNSYSLRIYNKNNVILREQSVPVEKNEQVLQCDMNVNKLVLIVQKNEKLYFKTFTLSL